MSLIVGDITNDSPLLTSLGWIDAAENFQNLDPEGDPTAENGVSINGLPLTEDFDLAVYVKGDRKPTAIYSARLVIEYEGEGGSEPPVEVYDVVLDALEVPTRITFGEDAELKVKIENEGPASASGVVTLDGVSNRGDTVNFSSSFNNLPADEEAEFVFDWTAPDDRPTTFYWTATVIADDDSDLSNNQATARTRVRRN
jgi:hypothetical protein